MLDRASLKHDNAFKQPCYHFLPLERIVVSFPLSLLLQPETLLAVLRCTNPGHVVFLKKESTVKEEVLQVLQNISLNVMINDWLTLGNIIVYLRLLIGQLSVFATYESKITFQILI